MLSFKLLTKNAIKIKALGGTGNGLESGFVKRWVNSVLITGPKSLIYFPISKTNETSKLFRNANFLRISTIRERKISETKVDRIICRLQ